MFSNVWKACPRVGESPVSHLLEPENVRALVNDHTYWVQLNEDCCLPAPSVLSISEADREKVECQTRIKQTLGH